MDKYKASSRGRRRQSAVGLAVELVREIALERIRGVGRYVTTHVTDEASVSANRRFATARFAELGKIAPELIDAETGVLKHDRFHMAGAAQYVSTTHEDELVSVGKMIWAEGIPLDELRTPFGVIAEHNPEFVERVRALPDGSVGELGSLAKTRGISQVATLSTLSEIYRLAETNDVRYLVAGLEPAVWPRYQALFGSGIELMCDVPLEYPGITGPQIGICMDITHAYEHYRRDFWTDSPAIRLQRVLVSELYANRVPSFRAHIGQSALRNVA